MADFLKIVKENITRDNSTCEVWFTCSYSDRMTEAATFVGGMIDGEYQEPDEYNYPPASDDDDDDSPNELYYLRASSVDIEPLGDYTDNDYDTALLKVSYSPWLTLDPSGNQDSDLLEISAHVSGEMMPLPDSTFSWDDGPDNGTPLGEGDVTANIVDPYVEVTAKYAYATTTGLEDLTDYVGYVNKSDFTLGDTTYGQYEVMLMGAKIEPSVGTDGFRTYIREFTFGIRVNESNGYGWNSSYDATDGKYYPIVDSDGNYPYADTDLSEVLFA